MTNERNNVLHSWCVQSEWQAPTIVGGEGARLRDEAGCQYLDMSSLAECSNLGHQHPHVVAAIRTQAEVTKQRRSACARIAATMCGCW